MTEILTSRTTLSSPPVLIPYSTILFCSSVSASPAAIPDYFFLFTVYPWWPPVCSASPCLPVSASVPPCMSAASFWPDLHNLWSSILYMADALWYMDVYGREVPPGAVSNAMSLKRTHSHTSINQSRVAVARWHKPPSNNTHEQHCSLFRGRETWRKTAQSEWGW